MCRETNKQNAMFGEDLPCHIVIHELFTVSSNVSCDCKLTLRTKAAVCGVDLSLDSLRILLRINSGPSQRRDSKPLTHRVLTLQPSGALPQTESLGASAALSRHICA